MPPAFTARLAHELERGGWPDGLEHYLASLDEPVARALRATALRSRDEAVLARFLAVVPGERDEADALTSRYGDWARVPWCPSARYLPDDVAAGRSLAARMGFVYLQEASALLPAELANVAPGERVIDLCAAPGGKAVRLASDLGGEGLLVANDLSLARARVLVRNLEASGAPNAVVTRADALQLADVWPGHFDVALLDAPCSGEGMFRRDRTARRAWDSHPPEQLLPLQAALLDAAARLLRPGGRLIYSTCTLNRLENEVQLARFLARFPDFELDPVEPAPAGCDPALPLPAEVDWPPGLAPAEERRLPGCYRLWPWRVAGEGHFVARLRRRGSAESAPREAAWRWGEGLPDEVAAFWTALLTPDARARLAARAGQAIDDDGQLHVQPPGYRRVRGIHRLKEGWYLGRLHRHGRRSRYVPAHAALVDMRRADLRHALVLAATDPRIRRIMNGETIALEPTDGVDYGALDRALDGWLPVCVEDWPLGWLRLLADGHLRNHYPPGWRIDQED